MTNIEFSDLVTEESDLDGTFVHFATGISFGYVTNTAAIDPGAVTGATGDPQFRLVFVVNGPGATTIDVGLRSPDHVFFAGVGGVVEGFSILIGMPEPGTAILLGLGLAGLAHRHRHRPPGRPY